MTAAGAPHPFPPVVRWAVFPAFAALAAAAGGVAAWALLGSGDPLVPTAFVGTLAVGSSLGSMVSRRRWVFLAASPVLGILAACAGLSLAGSAGPSRSPAELMLSLLREPRACLLFLGIPCLQGAAHTLSLQLRPAYRTIRSAGLYGVAALLTAFLALLCLDGRDVADAALFLFLSTLFQAAGFRASLALADTLRK